VELIRSPDAEIQPGDIFKNVPFLFPLQEPQVLRADGDQYRRHRVSDVTLGPRELAINERRLVYAMLHPFAPPCDIDKIIPPAGRKQPAESEDNALTFFHCRTRIEISDAWTRKLKDPESHIRFALLGEIQTEDSRLELAVNFRRDQQIATPLPPGMERIASLTVLGREFINRAYESYLRTGA